MSCSNRKAYLLFHHNLNFSSIKRESYLDVVEKCYIPLLNLSRNLNVKINIEAPAHTLEELCDISPKYIELLKECIADGFVEFVGSGYSQIIGPLWPSKINMLNLSYGNQRYLEILKVVPKVALINEMSCSTSLLSCYKEVGYESVVMDLDNVAMANALSKSKTATYNGLYFNDTESIHVNWSDSILFQKFQRVVHGEITQNEYVSALEKHFLFNCNSLIPIYTNDAEVFDFRPGRFKEEKSIQSSEWRGIESLIQTVINKFNISFVGLSSVIERDLNPIKVNSLISPVTVKKQQKYNVARWAVSGRDDSTINANIYKILDSFSLEELDPKLILRACSSDYRTHVGDGKWLELNQIFKELLPYKSNSGHITRLLEFESEPAPQRDFSDGNVRLAFDVRKGCAIRELSWSGHSLKLGTITHGHFDDIRYGADYYSGMTLIENVSNSIRITDLNQSQVFYKDTNDFYIVNASGDIGSTSFLKEYTLDKYDSSLVMKMETDIVTRGKCIVRVGNFVFPDLTEGSLLRYKSGGTSWENFKIDQNIDHFTPVSFLVSSTTGLGCGDQSIEIVSPIGHGIRVTWKNSFGYLLPGIRYYSDGTKNFLRLIFSLSEVDDTAREKDISINYEFKFEKFALN